MIIISRNNRNTISEFDTFTDEHKFFKQTIEGYQQPRPDYIKTALQVRNYTACFRTYNTKTGRQDIEVIAIVDELPIAHKQWKHEDKIVQNKQGGETHLNGWYLSR